MNFDPNTGEPLNNNAQQTTIPTQSKSNGMAIAGFIVSLLVSGLIGLILSIVGLNKVKECNSGKGLAIAGIIIGILRMIGTIIACILLFFTFGLFGAAINQAANCSMAYDCGTPNSSGMAECKYRDGDNVEQTVSCPVSNVPTTKAITTNTTKSSGTGKLTGAKEYKLDDEVEAAYYADTFYLINNNVYGHLTKNAPKSIKASDNVNGVDVALIVRNVVDVFVVEYGQAGFQKVFIVDGLGDAYEILNLDSKGQELYIKKVNGAKNIKNIYSLHVFDAIDYVFVNNKNQIVETRTDHTYAYIDKKNNINETLIGSDVIKLIFNNSEKDSKNEKLVHYSDDVYVNGTKQDKKATLDVNEDFESYSDVDLIQIEMKKSGGKYTY